MRKAISVVIFMAICSSVCWAHHSLIKEGDTYRIVIDRRSQVDVSELLIPACPVDPGCQVIWSDNAPKEAYFRPFTYEGIDGCDILLKEDPGPLLRIPIKGVFSRYGIIELRGVRFYLKIVHPDLIRVEVKSPHMCSREHWLRPERKAAEKVCVAPRAAKPRGTVVGHRTKGGTDR